MKSVYDYNELEQTLIDVALGYDYNETSVEQIKDAHGNVRSSHSIVSKQKLHPSPDIIKQILDMRIGGPQDYC